MSAPRPDPIRSLLASAREDQESRNFWFSLRIADLIGELVEGGFEIEDIPKALADYAAWMKANLDLFCDDDDD
jgi:hypothetical protein